MIYTPSLDCDIHSNPHPLIRVLFVVYNATVESGSIFLGFLVLLGFNVLFGIIAALLVFAVVNRSCISVFSNFELVLFHSLPCFFYVCSQWQLAVVSLRSSAISMESRFLASPGLQRSSQKLLGCSLPWQEVSNSTEQLCKV